MKFTGTIWRPPYEASSLLLEVTAGCTHDKCKFWTLYNDLPFKFRMEDIECDLQEAADTLAQWEGFQSDRAFLTGANPFVLKPESLLVIAELVRKYVPTVQTIGCFARVTDITLKSDSDLTALAQAGYLFLC